MNEFNHRILALLRVKQQREIPEKFRPAKPEWLKCDDQIHSYRNDSSFKAGYVVNISKPTHCAPLLHMLSVKYVLGRQKTLEKQR